MIAVALVVALTFIGSDRLVWFDAALIGYLFGTVFAVFGVVYRYAVWLRRPSTAMLNRRGWDAFRARKGRNLIALPSLVATQLLTQGFIRRRSRARWLAHQFVFWGCILAALVTFPLTLGLLHFESVGQQADRYQVYLSRVGTLKFDAGSILGWTIFHALDIAAVLVLAGVFIFLRRRLHDPGALAVERSGDFLALAGLFAVSVTGLFLTVSSTWLDGRFYSALNTIHALTVILGLMYLPFGKLFHIFQRPGNLGALSTGLGHVGADRARRRFRLMARTPLSEDELIARFGPHLNQAPPGGWDAGIEIDKVVETHCCFCGQQCGIKLKVHDNEVVGFEPWYDFPFNEGKLCPKGVKRYLQGSHPDGTRPGSARGVPRGHLGPSARSSRLGDPPHPVDLRRRRVRDVVRRVAHQ